MKNSHIKCIIYEYNTSSLYETQLDFVIATTDILLCYYLYNFENNHIYNNRIWVIWNDVIQGDKNCQ